MMERTWMKRAGCVLAVSTVLSSCAIERAPAGDGGTPMPQIVGDGLSSVEGAHDGPSGFDPTNGDFYFTRASKDFSRSRVYRVPWGSDVEPSLAAFSTAAFDAGAAFDPHERVVFFTSQRATDHPTIPDGWNLWRAAIGDGDATLLPEPVSSSSSECCVVVAPDGSFLFSSDRGGNWDIYRARPLEEGRTFAVIPLEGTIRSEHDEWPSFVAGDGQLVLFSSTRPGGFGGDDIYAACPTDESKDRWDAHHLGAPANSAAYEDSAMLTPDGGTLLWSSRRSRGDAHEDADIYELPVAAAMLPACARTE